MKKNELSEQDIQTLSKCLNDGVEPPAELAKKLFPSVCGSWDVAKLNSASIPTIEYAGKRSEAAILNEASAFGAGSPLQILRFFQGGKLKKDATQLELIKETGPTWETGWKNMIVQGDNLQFLKTCYLNQDPLIKDKVRGKVKLIYMDPPFATKSDFGASDGEDSYADQVDRAEFVESVRERLVFMAELLANDGSIYVHLDLRMVHQVKIVMDEIFGRQNFQSEIVWKRTAAHNDTRGIGNITDMLLFYRKSESAEWNPQFVAFDADYLEQFYRFVESDGRRYRLHQIERNPALGIRPNLIYPFNNYTPKYGWMVEEKKLIEMDKKGMIVWSKNGKPQRKIYLDQEQGRPITNLWDDIPPVQSLARERIAYPTQKPEALLERIILAGSNSGDLVMDPFGGSGTTAAVAEKLDRRWITCDFGKHAIYTTQKRLADISKSNKLGLPPDQRKKNIEYNQPPRDFCVLSVGAFDFAKIMDLRKNQDAYISFVLGVFGITTKDDKFAKKYHASNVVAEKDGNPVEVYPVWEDEYLRKVRVDMDYLKGILDQSGGKLKGNYYIISPESCVRVGTETALKNAKGERVTFRMLTFPYKVLEDAARNFQLSEQPSAPENINQLISSVGFYFNEEVEVMVKKTTKGFKVTKFSTTILNTSEQRYEGLDGLAMILIDTDYDGETFNVDTCVYQNDIKDGDFTLSGVKGKTAIIAVDKHGNESQITEIRG